MSRWWKDLITEDAPLSYVDERISRYDYPIIEKTQYDAFYNTNLEDHLKSNDITQLIICGVMTHLCCETTARSAFVRGIEVFFPVDGTATYNRDFHIASLRNLGHGFARLCKISELIEALDEKH